MAEEVAGRRRLPWAAADRAADPGRTAGVERRDPGYDESVLVDVVAVLVLLLMAGDVIRMLFVDR
ncbi:MAG TPA: hypothetical protein VE984_10995 [Gaiellaceae bacterium]|nr:hypothetical protein [Gaiellaceae bacterium]